MKPTFPQLKRSLEAVQKDAAAHAENLLILYADLPVPQIAEKAVAEIDEELDSELSVILKLEYFARLLRECRRKLAKTRQPQLPGFSHLPRRIQVGKRKSKRLLDATWNDLDRYVRALGSQYQDRRKKDPKLKEAVKLRDRMKSKGHGMTVAELLGITPSPTL